MIVSESVTRLASPIVYALVPVLVAVDHGEWVAGILIAAANIFEAVLIEPIAGMFADRHGSKPAVILGNILMGTAALVWLFFSIESMIVLSIFTLLLFSSYGFRNASETYVLRMSSKREGGLIFGITENIYAIAYFLSSILIPFFVIAENQILAAWLLLASSVFCFLGVMRIPNDIAPSRQRKKIRLTDMLKPWAAVRRAFYFLRKSNYYPVMAIGSAVFEGLFYGAIWFVFPLHIAQESTGLFEGGLQLGIYEVVTILMAGYTGYLADKYNWRHIHSLGWFVMALGVILLPFSNYPLWLILIGLIIAIGNNLFVFAADHALELYDGDHSADGSFLSLKQIALDTGYAISPLMVGFLYSAYGFTVSLSSISVLCVILAAMMIRITYKSERQQARAKRA